ncbi:3894_t:CDS:2, partial [Dentiscutata heterogama]
DALKCSHVSENPEQRENFNNNLENNEETNKQLSDSYSQINVTANTSQAVNADDQLSSDNMNQPNNSNRQAENNRETDEPMTNYHQSINVISRELEQMTLANNNTQAGDIKSIQDNDHEEGSEVSDDDSPGWSECEECYGNKKELCEYCGYSVCKWKDTLDSDGEDSQNIRKSSKKKKTSQDKKRETLSDPS